LSQRNNSNDVGGEATSAFPTNPHGSERQQATSRRFSGAVTKSRGIKRIVVTVTATLFRPVGLHELNQQGAAWNHARAPAGMLDVQSHRYPAAGCTVL